MRLSSNTIVLAFPLALAFTPGLSEVALILEPDLWGLTNTFGQETR